MPPDEFDEFQQQPSSAIVTPELLVMRSVAPSGTTLPRLSCTCVTRICDVIDGNTIGRRSGLMSTSAVAALTSVIVEIPSGTDVEEMLPFASAETTWMLTIETSPVTGLRPLAEYSAVTSPPETVKIW